jgi:hypothetical protein
MKNLADYIMVLDNVLSKETCEILIDAFDKTEDLVIRDSKWNQDYKSFKEINLTTNPEFAEAQQVFYDKTQEIYDFYKKHCKVEFFPEQIGFEDVRMKRYDANDLDQFGWHTDVGDYASARRFLVMFYYLNDVEEGGETIFNDKINNEINLTIKPKQGRIVVFPPMWMYPHKGMKPISGSKYIVSTYCHYI